MSSYDFNQNSRSGDVAGRIPQPIVVNVVSEPVGRAVPVARAVRRRVRLPILLFVATCLSTLLAGGVGGAEYIFWRESQAHGVIQAAMTALAYCGNYALVDGWKYAASLMTILVFHEMGHFLQARRYGVHASLPYFIPMPISPIGTFGAVIAMSSHIRDRRALFDIGITGPLAGLVPTLIFCVIGVHLSQVGPVLPGGVRFGDPLLIQLLARLQFGPIPAGHDIALNPMLFAGWVGLLITALNLMPIGQLDGGHILYGLLRTGAHKIAKLLLLAAAFAVFWFGLWHWTLMLVLLMIMGPIHPPTANDDVPLGTGRTVLGWLTLAFIFIGFTPTPFLLGT